MQVSYTCVSIRKPKAANNCPPPKERVHNKRKTSYDNDSSFET